VRTAANPAALVGVLRSMDLRDAIGILANFVVIAGLVVTGFRLFAQYHARGKWAKNITALLAGTGLLVLAFALLITPRNADVIARISQTKAHLIFLIASNALLLGAIIAYGLITYWKPLRLIYEQRIEKDMRSGLPKLP
jgi:hypothetical protein